jgi:hypothetical protein
MKNLFGFLVIALFCAGAGHQAAIGDWKLSGIYICSAVLNLLFIL